MRILIIDTNHADFVNVPEDYERIISLMDQDYPKGIHQVAI